MNIALVQAGQFRHPLTNELAIGIELLRLADRVENAEVRRRIGAGGGAPLPAAVVRRQVAIDQVAHEEALALAPVDQQVLGQEHGDDHAQAVVHPAGFQQLAHGRIDDRQAGAALLPGGQIFGAWRHGSASVSRRKARWRDTRG